MAQIRVQRDHDVPAGVRETRGERGAQTTVLGVRHDSHPLVRLGEVLRDLTGAVDGPVVDHEQFPVVVQLGERHRAELLEDRLLVVRGSQQGDVHMSGRGFVGVAVRGHGRESIRHPVQRTRRRYSDGHRS